MRNAVAITAVGVAIICVTVSAGTGLAFSVRPGLVLNAAQVGYQTDNLFLGAGLEFASVSFSDKTTYNSGGGDQTYTTKVDASVFLPQLAARMYFGGVQLGDGASTAGTARPYVSACLFYSIAGASISTSDGETTTRDTASEKMVKEVLGGNVGGTASFGGEYAISGSLGLCGEIGVRYMFGRAQMDYSSYGWDETMDTRLGLGFTYTTLGLNFYF